MNTNKVVSTKYRLLDGIDTDNTRSAQNLPIVKVYQEASVKTSNKLFKKNLGRYFNANAKGRSQNKGSLKDNAKKLIPLTKSRRIKKN